MVFNKGTLYVFQAKLVGDSSTNEADLLWKSKCNNKVVRVTKDGYVGTIEVDGVTYKVIRKWVRVIHPDKVQSFLAYTHQTDPNN